MISNIPPHNLAESSELSSQGLDEEQTLSLLTQDQLPTLHTYLFAGQLKLALDWHRMPDQPS